MTEQLLVILDEAFLDTPRSWHHFTTPAADSSYFGILPTIDLSTATQTVAGSSVAAQVKHITFAMRTATATIHQTKETPSPEDWLQSWKVITLDSETWQQLQKSLNDSYHELRQAIDQHGLDSSESLAAAIGAIAHVAYHLGSIKQKLAILRSD